MFKKLSYLVLIVVFSLTGLIFFVIKNAKFDYSYENFFPPEDSDIKHFKKYSDNYGSDNNFILIGIENKNGIFNSNFLSKIKAIGDSIKTFKNVEYILSPVHNSYQYKQGGIEGISKVPIINPEFKNLKEDSIAIYNNNKLIGSLFSENSKSICIYVQTCEKLAKKPGEKLVEQINSIIEKNGIKDYHTSGGIVGQNHFLKLMTNELFLFFIASFLLVIVFLWFTFKSFWGIIIPLIVVLTSIVWSIGIMHLTGKSFDIMLVMLPSIIFVVGMSDLVHLINKYLEELRNGHSEINAIKYSIKEVGLATFLTSATTAIGFLSLTMSNIPAIKDFGIYAGIGVMIAFFLTFIIVPPILLITKVPSKLLEKKITKRWNSFLTILFLNTLKHKKVIFAISLVLLTIGILSISQLKINNFLLEDLDDKDPIKKDFVFFENTFSGVRQFEMEIILKDSTKNILDFEVVQQIDKIEKYLKHNYTDKGIGFSISALDPIRYVYSIKHNNNQAYFKIPTKEKTYLAQLNLLKSISTKEFSSKLIGHDSLSAKYSGKIKDVGGAAIKVENKKLEEFISKNINQKLISVHLTGSALMIDKNNDFLAKNILWGLLLSCAVISIIIGLMYRSLSMILISLIVNILPLTLICLVMYFLNINIKISTSLIFTLAFGIAVDDTIHLMSKLKIELNKGKNLLYALKRAYLSTGKAMIVTSLILCGGFMTLILSNFTSTYLMGLLVSITLLLALLADLILLPLLIIRFYRIKAKT